MKTKFTLLILAFVAITSYSQGQDQVITLQGDTLTGDVSISFSNKLAQIVTLKNGKDKNHLKAYEIKSLLKGGETYHTIKIDGKYQLALLEKQGYLSLYKYVSNESSSSRGFTESILIKQDGPQRTVPNLGFKKQLGSFLDDCESVRLALNGKKYGKSDLHQIIDDYNLCISEKTALLNSGKPQINLNPGKSNNVEALMNAIKDNNDIEDKESILEMLDDLDSKIKKGATIPGYLKSALQNSLKNYQELTDQLNKILE